jgi:hypothetical protein
MLTLLLFDCLVDGLIDGLRVIVVVVVVVVVVVSLCAYRKMMCGWSVVEKVRLTLSFFLRWTDGLWMEHVRLASFFLAVQIRPSVDVVRHLCQVLRS